AALISPSGSVDWLCWPRFDSPSLFAALLDAEKGGRFALTPAGPFSSVRWYAKDTNVLLTRFSTEGGELLLTDFMPAMAEDERRRTMRPQCELVRLLQCSRGEVELDVVFDPRPGYALERCAVVSRGALGLRMR